MTADLGISGPQSFYINRKINPTVTPVEDAKADSDFVSGDVKFGISFETPNLMRPTS
jgi:hypothetical protein